MLSPKVSGFVCLTPQISGGWQPRYLSQPSLFRPLHLARYAAHYAPIAI
jgi:hypothetical protein